MFISLHRQYCCGINELKMVNPGDLRKALTASPFGMPVCYRKRMQYRYHCPHNKMAEMQAELEEVGFIRLATNDIETVWGKVG